MLRKFGIHIPDIDTKDILNRLEYMPTQPGEFNFDFGRLLTDGWAAMKILFQILIHPALWGAIAIITAIVITIACCTRFIRMNKCIAGEASTTS
jgi:hypothetical protein